MNRVEAVKQAATLLYEHTDDHDEPGDNLGQYRVQYRCECGFTFITDGHDPNEPGRLMRHLRHQMAVLADAGLLAPCERCAEYEQLFKMQWDRSQEADALWRAEDPEARQNVQPDLGVLLTWLMQRAEPNEPTRWWRALGPSGTIWVESSDEAEVREHARPGDTIQRLMRREIRQWVDAS